MTLTLILTRHAKSGWGDPALDDQDRPLNARGRRDAPEIGRWIAARATPQLALVSTARRAFETWQGLAEGLDHKPPAEMVGALYLAPPGDILKVLQRAVADCVLVIGHNPGIGALAAALPAARPAHPKFEQYPTAATLIVDFEARGWRDIAPGNGIARDFAVPRDL